MTNIRKQFIHINQRIEQAFKLSGRPPDNNITLLAVSKRHPYDKIQSLYDLGQRHFGESYLQEALQKIELLSHLDIVWHFIGPIQSNKTREIARHFQWVHSVDRIKIAQRLNSQRPSELPPLNICLQVNISQEIQKSGFSNIAIHNAIKGILPLPNLIIRGLMAIPEQVPDSSEQFMLQRTAFQQLRLLMQQLNQEYGLNMDTLSMGMSSDLEAAIAEGATIVRIGTALFGSREN
ncbi:MAG: YggS family pyridoxal phosphate-dependent enzyme [gamma proteobacterium symbiont of Taylorina sp.]|nr:YggS family pyridoxal phosphate-dependent enzyme [gamma proteobacterium symbiont of Taylorina sp.]